MSETAVRVAYVLYLLTISAGMVVAVLWLTSPAFRYWCFRQAQQLQYRWAVAEYNMRKMPVPDWLHRMVDATELPPEA